MTNNVNNLTNKQSYIGSEILQLSNSSGMQITHIGSSSYKFPHISHCFNLHQLLHVPSLSKNLLNVSKFVHDNNVFFEFYPTRCYVKNQATKQTLLQGNHSDGLYVFQEFPAFVSESHNTTLQSSFKLWHSRLGHVSLPVVMNILHNCNITCSPTRNVCEPCNYPRPNNYPL